MRALFSAGFALGLGCSWILGATAETSARNPPRKDALWEIGRFDESSAEFRAWIHPATGERQIDYSDPHSDPVFVVGRSDPAHDWLAFQPGSGNGGAGFREHPAVIEFELPSSPSKDLHLRVALLAYSARLPVLQVELNGRRGWFHQTPRLAYSAGDPAVFFQPHYATGTLTCPLSAQWFRPGTNRLTLTAIDVPGGREDVRPSGFPWPGSSGLIYDAIALEIPEEGAKPPPWSIRAEPTVFFRERNGRLFEEVDVTLSFRERPAAVRVGVQMGSKEIVAVSSPPRDFGEERITFEVPVWEGIREALIRVEADRESETFHLELTAARRWQLWVIAHEHLDIGYTDDDAKVAELHSRVLDDAMALSLRHPGFQFTADGFWVVEEFMAGRGVSAKRELIEAIRDGRLHVPAMHGSMFTGSASLEGLIRNLYPAARFARAHGTPFEVAAITDVPAYSWSLASVLAAAGIKYFVAASDAYRGPFLLHNRLHERSPHAWEGPDGGRVTTWYSRHYHQVSSLFGLPPRLTLGRDSLPRFLQAYDRAEYRSDDVILYGTQVENAALQPEQAAFATEWNGQYAFPRIRYGGFAEALSEIVRDQGALPVERGDGGPYWEDGLAANARVTALARENAHRILSAEKAASLAGLMNPRFAPDIESLAAAWRHSRLIDEHTWHADCSVRDPESEQARRQGEAKDAHAVDARRAFERVLRRSMSAVGEAAPAGPGTVLLFNPLSWPRGGMLELDVGRGLGLVDTLTGRPVYLEVLRSGRVYQRVRFMAPEVPAVGIRSLTLRPLPVRPSERDGRDAPNGTPPSGMILENSFYHVTLDPARGGIRSLVEKETGRELCDTNAGFVLGQLLYVTGGDVLPNRLVQYSTVSPIPELSVHPAGNGRLHGSRATEFAASAELVSETLRFPEVKTEILLPADRREIRITIRARKVATYEKEAAYVAFPFALAGPQFRYATQNGFVDPARDLQPGACREWFTVQDWLAVAGGESASGAVILALVDAPLVTLGDIVRGTWPTEFGQRPATVFSYIMSNYTPEGYAAAQGGEFVFRYVLTSSDGFDAAAAARFGAEALTPLEASEITRSDKLGAGKGDPDAVQTVGLFVEPREIHLSAWKPAEDGRGTVVRLLETAGRQSVATVAWPQGRSSRAWRCSAVEDDLEPIEVTDNRVRVAIPAFGLVTLRIE